MLKYNKDLIAYAKELRKDMTPWEMKLWNWFLRDYPIRFQRQKVIDNYIVDFYCAKARLVVELDGGGHYTEEQMQYDANRTEILEKYGLKVLRICNLEIDNNFYNVCEYIDREVKQSLPQSPDGDSPLVRGGK
ncbi:MAG: endonuclease domain-containing protein [Candidatus Fimenecus sp.]